ncbi:MAG: T9SS type A sorting domain-containing protein [Bacteroidales bacterium]|nr:T9SS type A sorting domain-containing protein [Bacteroidales bacterium]
MEEDLNSNSVEINLSNFAQGIYLIKIYTENNKYTRKTIKLRKKYYTLYF